MSYYRHTQIGTVVLAGMLFAMAIAVFVFTQVGPHPITLGALVMIAVLCALFATLTVEVTHEEVKLRFGVGLVRKSFAVTEIASARQVRNHWAYGWGIRLTPHGWLFNVSGLDAVELEMADGKRYRIGTDQPADLLRAIEQVTAER
jgi:hypothetical protein